MCFYNCECAGTDISQKDEKQTKTGKNEHESGMSADRSKKVIAELTLLKEDLRELRFVRFGPWLKFQEIFTFSPPRFRDCQL